MEFADNAYGLCVEAARIIATQLFTDAWSTTREKFAQVFLGSDDALVRRLDRDRLTAESADDKNQYEYAERFQDSWQSRLVDFLEDNPKATDELQRLVEELQEEAPAEVAPRIKASQRADRGGQNIISGRDTNIGGSRGRRSGK